LRNGAGLVTVITDGETAKLVHAASAESMTTAATRADEIVEAWSKKSAVLIGPGLADSEESYARTRDLVSRCELPMVIDASALNAFAGNASSLRATSPRIITPHPGELARLLDSDSATINADRLSHAKQAASATGCVTVLKGHRTLIAAPDGRVAINPTGNAAMASGGSGDVLGGIIVALLGRGVDAFDAACAGAYIHGLAADILRAEQGDTGMLALDLANAIPRAIEKVRHG
jgi:NAD(P)H-hydrate epimerase